MSTYLLECGARDANASLPFIYYYKDLFLEMHEDQQSFFSTIPKDVVLHLLQYLRFNFIVGETDGWFRWAAHGTTSEWSVPFMVRGNGEIFGEIPENEGTPKKTLTGNLKGCEFNITVNYDDTSKSLYRGVIGDTGQVLISVGIEKVGKSSAVTLWKEGDKGVGGGQLCIRWTDQENA